MCVCVCRFVGQTYWAFQNPLTNLRCQWQKTLMNLCQSRKERNNETNMLTYVRGDECWQGFKRKREKQAATLVGSLVHDEIKGTEIQLNNKCDEILLNDLDWAWTLCHMRLWDWRQQLRVKKRLWCSDLSEIVNS